MVKSAVYDAVGLSIFVLMTDALTRANAKYKRTRSAFGGCLQPLALCPAISGVLKGTPRDTVYPWGKGAHKHKSEHYRLR